MRVLYSLSFVAMIGCSLHSTVRKFPPHCLSIDPHAPLSAELLIEEEGVRSSFQVAAEWSSQRFVAVGFTPFGTRAFLFERSATHRRFVLEPAAGLHSQPELLEVLMDLAFSKPGPWTKDSNCRIRMERDSLVIEGHGDIARRVERQERGLRRVSVEFTGSAVSAQLEERPDESR
ncbi:MAG: hypothetical protein IT290_10985 [Deltaproteobacteria bacterium]|nr:hypothetical protein [Deltaproteobacteria bacterium]